MLLQHRISVLMVKNQNRILGTNDDFIQFKVIFTSQSVQQKLQYVLKLMLKNSCEHKTVQNFTELNFELCFSKFLGCKDVSTMGD